METGNDEYKLSTYTWHKYEHNVLGICYPSLGISIQNGVNHNYNHS